jgi:hypothetical protein
MFSCKQICKSRLSILFSSMPGTKQLTFYVNTENKNFIQTDILRQNSDMRNK